MIQVRDIWNNSTSPDLESVHEMNEHLLKFGCVYISVRPELGDGMGECDKRGELDDNI